MSATKTLKGIQIKGDNTVYQLPATNIADSFGTSSTIISGNSIRNVIQGQHSVALGDLHTIYGNNSIAGNINAVIKGHDNVVFNNTTVAYVVYSQGGKTSFVIPEGKEEWVYNEENEIVVHIPGTVDVLSNVSQGATTIDLYDSNKTGLGTFKIHSINVQEDENGMAIAYTGKLITSSIVKINQIATIKVKVGSYAKNNDNFMVGGVNLDLHKNNIMLGQMLYSDQNFTTYLGKANNLISNSNEAFIIGNGAYTAEAIFNPAHSGRSNAFTVDWEGNITHTEATQSTTGADYAEYFEWTDGNPAEEDRVGYIVAFDQDKIRLATATDTNLLGVVSGTAAVIGDTASWDWAGKYQVDKFGRTIWEDVEEFLDVEEEYEVVDSKGNTQTNTRTVRKSIGTFPRRKLTSDFDEAKEYIPRSKRPEWDTVGLMGKIHVRDDGTCIPGAYLKIGEPGIGTYSAMPTNFYVMKRIDTDVVLAFVK